MHSQNTCYVGTGGLRSPCVLACAMRSLAIVITIVQSFGHGRLGHPQSLEYFLTFSKRIGSNIAGFHQRTSKTTRWCKPNLVVNRFCPRLLLWTSVLCFKQHFGKFFWGSIIQSQPPGPTLVPRVSFFLSFVHPATEERRLDAN